MWCSETLLNTHVIRRDILLATIGHSTWAKATCYAIDPSALTRQLRILQRFPWELKTDQFLVGKHPIGLQSTFQSKHDPITCLTPNAHFTGRPRKS
jgi:hypothetical protein